MRLYSVAAIWMVTFAAQPIYSQTSADEEALKSRIAAHEQASAEKNLRGLVEVYSRDAEMISASGAIVRGRDSIEASYARLLASSSTQSGRYHTHPPDRIRMRFISADVALIDLPSRSLGGKDASGQPLAPSEVMLITVWRKDAGEWFVVSQRSLPASPASATTR